MITYRQFLAERFLNIFHTDTEQREQYRDTVWAMLQKAYEPIGGIKGSGFRSKDDMVANIPFWKIVRRGTDITAVVMYKDKTGRKLVAIATNGTPQGKKDLAEMVIADLKQDRSFMELSDTALKFLVRQVGYDLIVKYAKTPQDAAKILVNNQIEQPDPKSPDYTNHTPLQKFFYGRKIGGHLHTKILMGTTGNKIQADNYFA